MVLTEIVEPQINIRVAPEVEAIPPPIIIEPPITRELPWGFPVIDMPCAMTREKYSSGTSDYNVDPEGNMVLCEGGAETLADITQINADANTSAVDVEYVIVNA